MGPVREHTQYVKAGRRILLVSLVIGASFWIIDAFLDAMVFYEGDFLSLLFTDIPPHELYIRLFTVAAFVLGGIILAMYHYDRFREAEKARAYTEKYLRVIIDNSPECIKIMDSACTVVEMNPSGLAMLEADTAADVVGRTALKLVDPEFRDGFKEFVRAACLGKSGTFTFRITGLRGTGRWLESQGVPFIVAGAGKPLMIALTRDVTALRMATPGSPGSE